MENLPQKTEGRELQIGNDTRSIAIAVHNRNTKAIDLRRKMAQLPEVARALGEIEKFIFVASTKTLIADIDDFTLTEKTKKMFRFIAMDVGCKIPSDPGDWAYICTRLFTILKRYYSLLTLADVKLAFELSVTGELDEYLPRMANGQADKNHYQQFNAEYFGKILNAYKAKQSTVIVKAQNALPAPAKNTTPEEIEKLRENHNKVVDGCKMAFLKYKYFGIFDLSGLEYMFVYDWLLKVGFADDVKGTNEDRERALALYLKRISQGHGNKWDASQVRKEGADSSKIDFTVFEIARDKEIRRAFAQMIEEGIYINNYLKYK
jgi:hypothetical protein